MKSITIQEAQDIPQAIEDLNNKKGQVLCDWLGESFIRETTTLPRVSGQSIIGRGTQTVIRAQTFEGDVFNVTDDTDETISDFRLSDLTIRKVVGSNPANATGALFAHRRDGYETGLGGRLVNAVFKNLVFSMDNSFSGVGLLSHGNLYCKYENIVLDGGVNGKALGGDISGSYADINRIYHPTKGTIWNFLKVRSSGGTIRNVKSEGAMGDYELSIYDSENPIIQNFTSEGHDVNSQLVMKDCEGFIIQGGLLGGPQSTSTESNGLRLENCRHGDIQRMTIEARRDRGKAFYMDDYCYDIDSNIRIRNTDWQTAKSNGGLPVYSEVENKSMQKINMSYSDEMYKPGELTIRND